MIDSICEYYKSMMTKYPLVSIKFTHISGEENHEADRLSRLLEVHDISLETLWRMEEEEKKRRVNSIKVIDAHSIVNELARRFSKFSNLFSFIKFLLTGLRNWYGRSCGKVVNSVEDMDVIKSIAISSHCEVVESLNSVNQLELKYRLGKNCANLRQLISLNAHLQCFHGSEARTLCELRQDKHFILSGDRKLIRQIVKCCLTCQKVKSNLERRVNSLPEEKLILPAVYKRVMVDFLSLGDKRKLFIAIDCFSGHVSIQPAMNETTEEAIAGIRLISTERGPIKSVICDSASIFKSRAFADELKTMRIECMIVPPRAHFAIGKVERVHSMILRTFKVITAMRYSSKLPDVLSHSFYCMVKEMQKIINDRPIGCKFDEIITPEMLVSGRKSVSVTTGTRDAIEFKLLCKLREVFIQNHHQFLRERIQSTLKKKLVAVEHFSAGDRVLYSGKTGKITVNRSGVVTAVAPRRITIRDALDGKNKEFHPYQLVPVKLLNLIWNNGSDK